MTTYPFISPYTSNSLPEPDKLKVIDFFNRLDEKQAADFANGKTSNKWQHRIDYKNIHFGSISIAGLKIASRLLHVRVSKTDINWAEGENGDGALCCATAYASYNSQFPNPNSQLRLAGAYSLPADRDYAETIVSTMAQRNAIRKVVPEDLLVKFLTSKKVYFAHPLTIFGTQQARDALAHIGRKAPHWVIINPAVAVISKGREAMRECLAILRNCNALVFITNGHLNISKGVFTEIEAAIHSRIPTFWLNQNGDFNKVKTLAQFNCHQLDYQHYATVRVSIADCGLQIAE